MNLLAGQQWRCRHREQTCGHSGGRWGWDKWREWHRNIYITFCKTDSQWEFPVWCRELNPGLWHNLEGWDGVRGGREVPEGGDICRPKVDLCWCMAETNIFLQSNYLSIKNKEILTLKLEIELVWKEFLSSIIDKFILRCLLYTQMQIPIRWLGMWV